LTKTQKKIPAIYMTGTNVFIRGTTQFRAAPATLIFKIKRQ